MADLAELKAQYDALDMDDPKKAQLHQQITKVVTNQINAVPDVLGVRDGIVRGLQEQGFGQEFREGTPENTQIQGKYEAAGFLTKKTEEAAAAGEEKLAAGREALATGVETAKGELATGIETAKGELATGLDEAKAGIAGTKEEVTGTLEAGAEEMKAAAAETGTRLEDIGAKAGADVTAATAATGQQLTDIAATAGEDIQARGEAAETKMTDAWTGAEAKAEEKLGAYSLAGKKAMGAYEGMMGLGGESAEDIQSQLEKTPGYQFNLKEGLKATGRGAAARGGALGGRALIELQERGAGIASQTFNTRVGQLSNMAGMGLQAGTTLSNIGQNVAAGVSGAAQTGLQAGITGAQTTAAGASRGAEVAGAGAVTGIEMASGGARSGAMYEGEATQRAISTETTGKAGVQQWAGGTEASMTASGAGAQADLTTRGASGAAATTMTGATGEAGNYQQAAGMAASLYGNLASQGTGVAMTSAQIQAQSEWQRLEADLARDMAEWQGGQALFGDLMSVGGSILGGPIGGGIASAIFG